MYNTVMFLIYICITEHKHFRCIHLLKSYLKIQVLSNIQFYIILFCALCLRWDLGKMQINYCSCFIHVFTTNLISNNRKNTLINKWLCISEQPAFVVGQNDQGNTVGTQFVRILLRSSYWDNRIRESLNRDTAPRTGWFTELPLCRKNKQWKTLNNNNKTNSTQSNWN